MRERHHLRLVHSTPTARPVRNRKHASYVEALEQRCNDLCTLIEEQTNALIDKQNHIEELEKELKMPSYALFHNNESARVAREAHATLMRSHAGGGGPTELYLWYTPMKLWVAENKPHEHAVLGCAERIPGHLTVDQLCYWMAERTARLPYLTT